MPQSINAPGQLSNNSSTFYIDKLIKDCNTAKTAIPIREFEMDKLSDLNDINMAIYIIEEIDGDPKNTYNMFVQYRQRKERKCAKPNAPSQVLYVGSSSTGLRKRISQHLGDEYKDTYSLHLKHWFKGKYKITVKVYDIERDVLQILEDALSFEKKPAFGKLGGNNK